MPACVAVLAALVITAFAEPPLPSPAVMSANLPRAQPRDRFTSLLVNVDATGHNIVSAAEGEPPLAGSFHEDQTAVAQSLISAKSSDQSGGEPVLNDYSALIDRGTLTSGQLIPYDNTGGGNNFDGSDSALCNGSFYGTGNGGNDVIFQFQVDECGTWRFDTGCVPAAGGNQGGGDTSVQLRQGAICPGTVIACNGDACGSFASTVSSFLTTADTYYLVVDAYAAGLEAAGIVSAVNVQPCCFEDSDCADGLFCNGAETCNVMTGECIPATNPCTSYQTCSEANDVCVGPDPCIGWWSGPRSGFYFPAANHTACPAGNGLVADDVRLATFAGRDLISYQITPLARAAPPGASPWGTPYSVTMELWDVANDGSCLPGAPIPGTSCVVQGFILPSASPVDIFVCAPNGGMPTGVILPVGSDGDPGNDQCGVDFYITYRTAEKGFGFAIAGREQLIGGPALDDDFGQSVFVLEDCGTMTFGFAAFGPPNVSDFTGARVCTVPEGPCCDALGGCAVRKEEDCLASGGTFLGESTIGNPLSCDSPDTDGDGVRDECDGCPDDPDKAAPGQCGCANPDTDTDNDGTADCLDGCPNDPNKTEPDFCGCGVAETGDSDGDGVADCIDQCPGADDALFAPGCLGAIPAASHWGLLILALLLLAGAKLRFGRNPSESP